MLCSLTIKVLCLACSPAWGPLQWWFEGAALTFLEVLLGRCLEMLKHRPQSSRSVFIPSEDRVLKVFKLKIQLSGCSKNTKLSFGGGSPRILAVEKVVLGEGCSSLPSSLHIEEGSCRILAGILQGLRHGVTHCNVSLYVGQAVVMISTRIWSMWLMWVH